MQQQQAAESGNAGKAARQAVVRRAPLLSLFLLCGACGITEIENDTGGSGSGGSGGELSQPESWSRRLVNGVLLGPDYAPATRINFQNPEAVPPTGYVPDFGLVFGDRGNGLTYGWDSDRSDKGRERAAIDDQRYDTLMHLHMLSDDPGGVWELEVPNASYLVYLVAGDPIFQNRPSGRPGWL